MSHRWIRSIAAITRNFMLPTRVRRTHPCNLLKAG
jgi:hypothetical protein